MRVIRVFLFDVSFATLELHVITLMSSTDYSREQRSNFEPSYDNGSVLSGQYDDIHSDVEDSDPLVPQPRQACLYSMNLLTLVSLYDISLKLM